MVDTLILKHFFEQKKSLLAPHTEVFHILACKQGFIHIQRIPCAEHLVRNGASDAAH